MHNTIWQYIIPYYAYLVVYTRIYGVIILHTLTEEGLKILLLRFFPMKLLLNTHTRTYCVFFCCFFWLNIFASLPTRFNANKSIIYNIYHQCVCVCKTMRKFYHNRRDREDCLQKKGRWWCAIERRVFNRFLLLIQGKGIEAFKRKRVEDATTTFNLCRLIRNI